MRSPRTLTALSMVLASVAVPFAAQTAPQATGPVVVPVQPTPPFQRVLPQNDVLPATLSAIDANRETIQSAIVIVELGQSTENPRWMMGNTQLQVFLEKILTLPQAPVLEDSIWPKLPRLNPHYRGVRVLLKTDTGKSFAPFMVFEGAITAPNGATAAKDYGRFLEYFLIGTARVRRDQMLGTTILPVFSFEQCRLMGQKIVESSPRQCLLPDHNLMLETGDKPTLASARIRSFDECLEHGEALIYTFPRRCLAAGGRVLTEPPQVYEAKQQAEAARKAKAEALVESSPRNTPFNRPSPTGPSPTTVLPSRTTVVAMPTVTPLASATIRPSTPMFPPALAVPPSPTALSPSVPAAIAAAKSILTPAATPVSHSLLPFRTLGH